MNTHDKYELPPLPVHDIFEAHEFMVSVQVMAVQTAQSYARAAIEADRKKFGRNDSDILKHRGEPNWDSIKDKRMSELSWSQINDAHELWLRGQWRWFGEQEGSAGIHIKFLLDRLDEIRART